MMIVTNNLKLNGVNKMKAKRIFRITILALLTGFTIVSCNDFDEELEVLTDVYVINKKFGGEVRSANAYYAYANQTLSGATVTKPNNGGMVQLENYTGSIYTFAKEPVDSDYKTTAPVEGSYTFTVQGSNGETLQVTDVLDYANLGIPQFTKIKFSGTPLILELEWSDVTDADGFVIKMFDTQGKLVFNGYSIDDDVNKYTITGTSNSGFWNTPAVNGESYLLQVNAFSYDAEANQTNYIYNVSEISIGESQIVWGVN